MNEKFERFKPLKINWNWETEIGLKIDLYWIIISYLEVLAVGGSIEMELSGINT